MDERTTDVPSLEYILVHVIASLVMIFGINITISRAVRRVKFETTLKFHEWYFMPNITYKSCYYLFTVYYYPQKVCHFHM